MRELLLANIAAIESYRDDPSDAHRQAAVAVVEKALQGACERVFRLGQKDDKKRGMGTTMDVVVRAGDRAILGHVGDGRVYLVRGGQTYRLTKDHTIVAAQVEAGVLTPEEAEQSTLRGVLTRALGTHESVQVDTLVLDLAAGDLLLLCTDGLHRYLDAEGSPRDQRFRLPLPPGEGWGEGKLPAPPAPLPGGEGSCDRNEGMPQISTIRASRDEFARRAPVRSAR